VRFPHFDYRWLWLPAPPPSAAPNLIHHGLNKGNSAWQEEGIEGFSFRRTTPNTILTNVLLWRHENPNAIYTTAVITWATGSHK
jgi:hypothetical protein